MRKWKRWLAASVSIALVAMVACWAFLGQPIEPGLTGDNFLRIRSGMTRAEVEAIFGGPPVGGGPKAIDDRRKEKPVYDSVLAWQDEKTGVWVLIFMDQDGKVVNKLANREPLSRLNRLRYWLGL